MYRLIAVLVLVLLAIWWSWRVDEGTPAAPPVAAAVQAPLRARPEPQLAPARLAHVAESDRGAALRASTTGLDDWLANRHPNARPALFDIDCSFAPCSVVVAYDARRASESRELHVLVRGVRTEVERRVGYRMSVVHVDEDAHGHGYLWMYGLPPELASDEREELRRAAEHRYSTWMDPVRARGPSPHDVRHDPDSLLRVDRVDRDIAPTR
jgi:hypothetical protein